MTYHSRFTFDFAVFRQLIRARNERRGRSWWHRYLALITLFAVVLVATLWSDGALRDVPNWTASVWATSSRVALLYLAGLLVAVTAIDYVFDHYVYRLAFNRYSVAGQPVEADISADGIVTRRAGMSTVVAWSAVKGITVLRDNSAVCIWLGKIEGILLPAASFASPADFEAACTFLKEKTIGA